MLVIKVLPIRLGICTPDSRLVDKRFYYRYSGFQSCLNVFSLDRLMTARLVDDSTSVYRTNVTH